MNDNNKRPGTSRRRILDAADELVREIGAGRLTLEAVADRAGLSKGGLLYNFPSKDALLQGMLARMIEDYRAIKEKLRKKLGRRKNLEARLVIATALEVRNSSQQRFACGILAAVAENPALLEPVREAIAAEWQKLKEETEDPDASLLAWLAVEGLTNLEMNRLSPLSDAEKARLLATIDRLLDHGLSDGKAVAAGPRALSASPEA